MMGGPPTHLMWSNMFNPEKPQITRAIQWRRLGAFFRPYLREQLIVLGCIFVGALLGLLPPIFTKWLIDGVLKTGNFTTIAENVGGMVAAALAAGFVAVYQGYVNARFGEGILRDIRIAMVSHLQTMPLRFFTNTKSGEILNRVSSDVDNIDNVLTGTLSTIVTNVVIMVTTLITIFILDWRLSLISLAIIPLMILPLGPVGSRMYDIRKLTRVSRDEMEVQTQATLSMSGITLMKSFVRETFERRKYQGLAQELMQREITLAMVGRWFMASMNAMVVIGPALVWLAGAWYVTKGTATIGTVVAFVAFLSRLYGPASAIAGVQVQIVSALAVFERILEYLDMEPELEKPDAHSNVVSLGEIAFEAVSFGYEPERTILDNVNFAVQPGQMAAFVGHSGAGKSTLLSLLPRFYDVTQGRITLDGIDIRDWTLSSLRSHIGIVTQETYLFHDTVKANLIYGRPEATDAEMIAAAKTANIHDVIAALPLGYATLVGERGHKLSGGERQRLAIARALLKDPRILILDEATSALDSHNETLIQQALAKLMNGRTSLVIAHRLSTVIQADAIFVLEQGRIIEQGRHAALLALDGAYAKLYREQFERAPTAGELLPLDEISVIEPTAREGSTEALPGVL